MIRKKLLCFVVLLGLFMVTGCGEPTNRNTLNEYLEKNYSDETFTVINETKLKAINNTCGNGESDVEGSRYIVKSNDTGIQFTVSDTYGESGYGVCNYYTADNYEGVAMKKYTLDYNDKRFSTRNCDLEDSLRCDVITKLSYFKSINEAAKAIKKYYNYIYSKKPFKKNNASSLYFVDKNIYLYVYDYSTEKDIIKEIRSNLKKNKN